jgi:hypothetical protein
MLRRPAVATKKSTWSGIVAFPPENLTNKTNKATVTSKSTLSSSTNLKMACYSRSATVHFHRRSDEKLPSFVRQTVDS